MELGLEGRRAIVCASSRGLGFACALELARAGVAVTVNGRSRETLEPAAERIRAETGAEVSVVAADVGTPEGQDALFAACPAPDILVTNNAGPPPRPFAELDRAAMLKGVEANMITPLELIRRALPGMAERGFGRIVNITSISVKMPLAGLDLSSGARAGLTSFLAGVARDHARHNVTINNLLPGMVDTERLSSVIAAGAERAGQEVAAERARQAAGIPAGRFGEPEEFGYACAFLCGARAGYISGQNLLMDGALYPSSF